MFLFWRLIRKRNSSRARELLIVRKKKGKIYSLPIACYESRAEATLSLIESACAGDQVPDFKNILVYTGDWGKQHFLGKPVFSYSADNGDYSRVCPDFVFGHWKEVGQADYEITRQAMSENGKRPATTDKLGWIGSTFRSMPVHGKIISVVVRDQLLEISAKHPELIEAIDVSWSRDKPLLTDTPRFISMPDQVSRWKFLIDVEGLGYSARFKLLLFSRRVVFLVDRPWKEWFYQDIIPWKHYVPVKRDLSDLLENLKKVSKDQALADRIANDGYEFALANLTRDHAVKRWRELLLGVSSGSNPSL
jgi:hypothetical protein